MASIDATVGGIVVSVGNQLAPSLSQLVPPLPPDVDPMLLTYLESPDFEKVAHQVVLRRAMRKRLDSEPASDLREQIVQGLRHAGASSAPKAVLTALSGAEPLRADDLDSPTALAEFHEYAGRLRAQVVAAHAEMRLPHIGVSRSRATPRSLRAAHAEPGPHRRRPEPAGQAHRAAR